MQAVKMAAATDVVFFFMFHYLNSPILAWFNVFSVCAYACAYYALKHKRNGVASILFFTEVFVHAALGVLLIGWDSGFHYYLIIFIPALCLTSSKLKATVALSLLFMYYIGLRLLSIYFEPLQPIDSSVLNFVYVFNVSVVFFLLSYLSFFYLGTVKRAQRKLHIMATTDPLTDLYNRRHLRFLLNKEAHNARENKPSISLILIDIDHFKNINDTYGHEVGDTVLIQIAQILKNEMREQDLVARWGGEEFLIIMPNATPNDAMISAKRIQTALAQFPWDKSFNFSLTPTISAGISVFDEDEDLNLAVNRADKALYRCKESGRNRIEVDIELSN